MRAKRVSREEQLKFTIECHASDFSDQQQYETQGIDPSTFYNWVSKPPKADVTIPDSESKHLGTPVNQEVVKVNLVSSSSSPTIVEQNTRILSMPDIDASVAWEIVMGNSASRFFHNRNSELIRTMLQCLGGMSHDW